MTKNRTPTPVYLDPGMHSGLEVKGLKYCSEVMESIQFWFNSCFVRFSDHEKAQNLALAMKSRNPVRPGLLWGRRRRSGSAIRPWHCQWPGCQAWHSFCNSSRPIKHCSVKISRLSIKFQGRIQVKKEGTQVARGGEFLGIFRPNLGTF